MEIRAIGIASKDHLACKKGLYSLTSCCCFSLRSELPIKMTSSATMVVDCSWVPFES